MVKERFNSNLGYNLSVYAILGMVIFFIALPLINSIASSFSDPIEIATGRVFFWPVKPTLIGYEDVFKTPMVWIGYANSIFVALVGTLLSLFFTAMAAYPLSRKDMLGRKAIMKLIVVSMTIHGGLIPMFLVVKTLGLVNSRMSLIIPFLFSNFNLLVMITFFRESLPSELFESAKIDGCSNFRFFMQIVLPTSGSILSVIALYYGAAYWNDFFHALIFINDKKSYTLPLVLRDILIAAESSMDPMGDQTPTSGMYRAIGMRFALIWVASIPMLVLYPFLQRNFVKGVMLGAVKG